MKKLLLALAACASLGIAALPGYICRTELREGTLQQLLPDWSAADARISALIRAKSEGSGADLSAVKDAIDALRSRLDSVKEIKKTLTAIDSTTEKARDELDALRAAIVTEIDRIEELVRASSAAAHGR